MGPGVHLDSMVQGNVWAKEIVWLEEPLKYTYLRELAYLTRDPRRFPVKTLYRRKRVRVIGYEVAERKKGIGHTLCCRRYWCLKPHDRDLDPHGVYQECCPPEAVHPSSILLNDCSIPFELSLHCMDDERRPRTSRGHRLRAKANYPGDLHEPDLP
jgi:hypothetical protein